MDAALVRLVWRRAHRCCEYCGMPQDCDEITFEIDHVIARKHGGPTVAGNLALSCLWCNAFNAGFPPGAGRLADIERKLERILLQYPELQKASLQISYADYDVRIKRAQFIPDLSLVFKYVSPVTSDVLPKNIAYVGVQFDWDIWDWGKKRQDMTQSQRALEQARNSVAETASQVTLDVNSSFRKLQDSQAFVTVARLNRDAAREKLRVAINQYRQQSALLPICQTSADTGCGNRNGC